MKKFLKEFEEFALKGNMIDLAVGMIIGSAFNGLVKSMVDNLIMPLLGLVMGKMDFSNLFIALNGVSYATLKEAQEAAAPVFAYGLFITEIINFLIMAFVVFLFVKEINLLRTRGKKEEPAPAPAPTEKECPYCKSKIAIDAVRCPHCTSILDESVFAETK
ncbi:MAG: large conductance mechanosensitive channel protein MscL [Lachnospiraceae bacterium]|nr:large conductance mechanosensitive channel protein MscL [Lachnospiraceae bacterium]